MPEAIQEFPAIEEFPAIQEFPADGPQLNPLPARSPAAELGAALRARLGNLIGPSPATMEQESIPWPDAHGQITRQYKPLAGAVDREGLFPALSHPFVPLPRVQAQREPLPEIPWGLMSDGPMLTAEGGAALANTAAGFAEFAESPLGVMTAGAGGLGSSVLKRIMAGGYAADIARHTPEAAAHAGEMSVTGTPQEQMEADLGLAANVALPATLGSHALARGTMEQKATKVAKTETFSEFGGEPVARPSAQTIEEFPAVTERPAPTAVPEAGAPKAQPITDTVPEAPNTILAQFDWLRRGKRPAVMIGEDTTVPKWVTEGDQFDSVSTPAGKFVYDTATLTKDQIHQAVANDTVGDVLGYGIARKPAAGTDIGTVVVRDKTGTEKQAVVTDAVNLPAVLKRAQELADETDTVKLETAEDVIAKRQAATGPRPETDRERFSREQREASEYMRQEREKAKAAGEQGSRGESEIATATTPPAAAASASPRLGGEPLPPVTVTERHLQEAREALSGDRPPDVLDDVEGQVSTTGMVRFPAEDYGQAIDRVREEWSQRLYQKPYQILRKPQRQAVDRRHKLSTTSGEPVDQVLKTLAAENPKYADWTPDDLQTAMERAAGNRHEAPLTPAMRALAEEMARAEAGEKPGEKPEARSQEPEEVDPWAETISDANADTALHDAPATLQEPAYVPTRKAELDEIASDLYGKPYDELTEFERGNAQVTLEHEDARARQDEVSAAPEPGRELERPAASAEPVAGEPARSVRHWATRTETQRQRYELAREIFKRDYQELSEPNQAHVRDELQRGRTAGEVITDPIELKLRELWDERARQEERYYYSEKKANGNLTVKGVNAISTIRLIDGQLQMLREISNANPETKAQWLAALTKGDKPETRDRIIDALNSLKVDMDGQLHAFGLLPAAWNTLIDIAKLAVRGGRALGEAIDYAIEEFKRRNPTVTFDEAGARQQLLQEVPTRATGQKITATALISDETKRAIHEYIYEPRSNRTDAETAAGLVDQFGVDAATALWRTPPADFPGAVKSKLLGAITRSLADAEQAAKSAGDQATADAMIEQQRLLWDEALPKITNVAQELQAMSDLVAMSPDAHVARVKRQVEAAGTAEIERHRGETDNMRNALDEGRTNGIEAVRHDPAVNESARAAVDEAIKNDPHTHKAIVMELAEPWAQSPEILAHAREQVRSKANELLNSRPRPPGLTPAAHLRQILDDLAGRAAGIFAGHIQGSEPGVSIVEKLQQRLGVDRASAQKLASSLSKEWDRQLEAAKKQLDTRLAKQRARQQAGLPADSQAPTVDQLLRQQLRAMNLRLGDAIRQAAADRQRTGEHIAESIVKASGLEGTAADLLRDNLRKRYDALTGEAQRNALATIEKRSGVKVGKKMREAFDKLVEIDRLAPGDGEAFTKAVRAALKLPELNESQARELRKLVQDAQTLPEGFQQQRAMSKVLTFTERAKGELGWKDVPLAVWYANIFSGPLTHAANVIGNTFKALEVLGVQTLLHPTAAPQILKAFARGAETGTLEAASVMRTGSLEGTRLLKAEPARPLEWRVQQGGWNQVFLPWAAVGRALAAEDVLFFKGHEEVKWHLLARRVARREGLRGEQLDARVQDLLHNTRAEYEAAKVQAAGEGLTDALDVRRRAHEIIEQRREQALPGSTETARNFGLEHTFNAEPYGVMGALAEVLNTANRKLKVTRFAIPVVRIVANLANESLNYFPPVGVARVALPKWRSDIIERAGGDTEALHYAVARAAVGTVLFGALAATVANSLDDPDAPVALTGQGPRTKDQREQLRATGWKPNSIKLGDRYYSYQETHLAIPLAILGNYSDALRYKGLDRQDALNRLAYVVQTTLNTILDQRMLSGLGDLMNALKPDSAGSRELNQMLTRTATSFAVPNALKWMDQVFDPAVYEADDVKGALYAQTPFVRRLNRPALNALGEPITRAPLDRFTTPAKPDELMRTMARLNAWVPLPALDDQFVGDKKLGLDYIRPMSPDEYYTWIAESGPRIRERLTAELDTLAGLSAPEAQAFVRKIAAEERRATKERITY